MSVRSSWARKGFGLVWAIGLVVSGACGSDSSDEGAAKAAAKEAAPAEAPAPAADGDAGEEIPDAAAAPEAAPAPADPGVAAAPAPAVSGAAGGTPSPAKAAAPKPSGAAPARTNAAGGSAPAASSDSGAKTAPAGGDNTPAPAGAPAPAPSPGGAEAPQVSGPKDTTPIVIGSIGTLSGIPGATIRQTSEAIQVWAASVTAKGGVNGRPVKVIAADDGGDPARYKSELQRLVEQEKVVALVGNPDAFTGSAGVEYVTSKGVPYIGGDGGGDWFYSSPMYFPQGSVGNQLSTVEIFDAADYAKAKGLNKFGIVTCTEAEFCRTSDRIWSQEAPKAGLDLVYRARSSIAQPDFTAECLAAQRSGAVILELALDANSLRRFAESCSRQGYKPVLGWVAGVAQDDQRKIAALNGSRFTLFSFSWSQNDTPATAEFQEAMKKFGGDMKPLTAGHTGGWVAAKLFERAVGDTPGKITREAVLAGLWSLKGETLGGIAPPLTFVKGQKATRDLCSVAVAIEDGELKPLNGGKYKCR
jgi:branched-chain amino acid transport system substrate-binding protein